MSITYYIPNSSYYFLLDTQQINIIGIHAIRLDIDRQQAFYSVWVDTVAIRPLLRGTMDAIVLSPEELNTAATFVVNHNHIDCKLKQAHYQNHKHAYLVEFEFVLDKNMIKDFIHIKRSKKDEEENNDTGALSYIDLE